MEFAKKKSTKSHFQVVLPLLLTLVFQNICASLTVDKQFLNPQKLYSIIGIQKIHSSSKRNILMCVCIYRSMIYHGITIYSYYTESIDLKYSNFFMSKLTSFLQLFHCNIFSPPKELCNLVQGLYSLYLASLSLCLLTSTLLSLTLFSTHWEGTRYRNRGRNRNRSRGRCSYRYSNRGRNRNRNWFKVIQKRAVIDLYTLSLSE